MKKPLFVAKVTILVFALALLSSPTAFSQSYPSAILGGHFADPDRRGEGLTVHQFDNYRKIVMLLFVWERVELDNGELTAHPVIWVSEPVDLATTLFDVRFTRSVPTQTFIDTGLPDENGNISVPSIAVEATVLFDQEPVCPSPQPFNVCPVTGVTLIFEDRLIMLDRLITAS